MRMSATTGTASGVTLQGCLLLKPSLPGSVHVILDDAGLIGIDAVHGEMDRATSGTQGTAREIAAQPENGLGTAAHHRLLRRCLIRIKRGAKPRRALQFREERCCEICRMVDDLRNSDASGVQRNTVAEDQQKNQWQYECDGDAGRIADISYTSFRIKPASDACQFHEALRLVAHVPQSAR